MYDSAATQLLLRCRLRQAAVPSRWVCFCLWYVYPPLRNSKRCFKTSTQNYTIEIFKLVGEPKVKIPRVRPCSIPNDVLKHQHKTVKLKILNS
ncbi:hypothetical protein FUT84_12040 [Treponema phagedenis]|nr:hypothetical protein HMPREF9554_02168 [Treponema phagedenis F0421]QEK01810.1 hypothetical protein FUT84_12040 [Treponema phagedenis]QEK04564.1 hypothetical protein FUT83_12645 [Treponema phagedenis]QEK06923.1 hypothetical protein FUT80_09525 [Treponema phagedenis]QEK10220.1 hypothetical protein FUT81_12780 [Treponema phagedenis]